MKTALIIALLAAIAFYSLRSLIRHFKGEDSCCGCAGKNGGTCNCSHKHQKNNI